MICVLMSFQCMQRSMRHAPYTARKSISRSTTAYRHRPACCLHKIVLHHVCLCVFAWVCVCVYGRERGGFSSSIECDGVDCSVSLSWPWSWGRQSVSQGLQPNWQNVCVCVSSPWFDSIYPACCLRRVETSYVQNGYFSRFQIQKQQNQRIHKLKTSLWICYFWCFLCYIKNESHHTYDDDDDDDQLGRWLTKKLLKLEYGDKRFLPDCNDLYVPIACCGVFVFYAAFWLM